MIVQRTLLFVMKQNKTKKNTIGRTEQQQTGLDTLCRCTMLLQNTTAITCTQNQKKKMTFFKSSPSDRPYYDSPQFDVVVCDESIFVIWITLDKSFDYFWSCCRKDEQST